MTAAIAEVPKTKDAPAPHLQRASELLTVMIDVNRIVRSETNRVPNVDDDFVENIRINGVMQAVLLRPIQATIDHVTHQPVNKTPFGVGDTIYKLVYGERRWLAAKKADKTHIKSEIRELTDTRALEIQIAENEHRDDYDVMDRAAAYAHLRTQYMLDHKGEKGWTEEKCMDLIASTCKNDKIKGRTVQQIIALGKLHMFCQAALRQGEMEASHGYELCRRSEEEQLQLLDWLRRETRHGQGDIPSVRRLKREIAEMDRIADERRRQQKLFKDPQPGTATTKVPTVAEATAARTQPMRDHLKRVSQAQTSARSHGIDNRSAPPMSTLTPAARIRIAEKRIEANRAREEKQTRSVEIERQARVLALDAIAKKVKLDRALLDLVAVDMLKNYDDDVSQFAVRVYNFPKPKAKTFSYNEIEKIGLAQVPKLKAGQLAGLIVAGLLAEEMFVYSGGRNECKRLEAMARKYKVNLGKIRKDLVAAAKPKAKSQKPKAGVRA